MHACSPDRCSGTVVDLNGKTIGFDLQCDLMRQVCSKPRAIDLVQTLKGASLLH